MAESIKIIGEPFDWNRFLTWFKEIPEYLRLEIESGLQVFRATLDNRPKQVHDLYQAHTGFSGLLVEAYDHIEHITGSSLSLEDLKSRGLRPKWDDIIRNNNIVPFLMGLIEDQFKAFILQTIFGAYEGAPSNLRWILETVLRGAEFQTSESRPTVPAISKTIVAGGDVSTGAFHAFSELLDYQERFPSRKTTVREIVNALGSKPRNFFTDFGKAKEECVKLWKDLSKLAHTTPKAIRKPVQSTVPSYAIISYLGNFSLPRFDELYNLGIRTVDLSYFLLTKVVAHYYGYQTAQDFLRVCARSVVGSTLIWSVRIIRENDVLQLPFTHSLTEPLEATLR